MHHEDKLANGKVITAVAIEDVHCLERGDLGLSK